MDKTDLKKKFLTKKTQDYTYAIAFFLIFSFFIFYIIRPNLITVFEIKAKIDQLKKINKSYEAQIDSIIEIQSQVEQYREDIVVLKEAIASKPEVNKLLSDIEISRDENNLNSEKSAVSDINLKDTGSANKLKSYAIKMNLSGSFEELMSFFSRLYEQRRLKFISNLDISHDKVSSQSANLKVNLDVEGFYL